MAPPRAHCRLCRNPATPTSRRAGAKKSTFRNGTMEEGWFYPTPAALKAAADVRGGARGAVILRPSMPTSRAQATFMPTTRTSSSTQPNYAAWCTGVTSPLNSCLRSPEVARHLPEDCGPPRPRGERPRVSSR